MSGFFWGLAVLAGLTVVGAPIATGVSRTRRDWTSLAFEAGVVGLVVEELIGLIAPHLGIYSRLSVVVTTVVVVGVSTFALRRARAGEGWASILPTRHARVRLGVLVVAPLLLLAAALWLRRVPSYFLFETGDMGDYMNHANILARTGTLTGFFPHGFVVFLADTNLLVGRSRSVAGLPSLGIMLLLGVLAYMRTIKLAIPAVLGIALIVVVHPEAVWFSLFPVSESLYAVLLIASLYLILCARKQESTAYAVLAGVVVGLMLIVRGEALLLAPIVAFAVLASAAVDRPETVAVQKTFTVTSLLGLAAAYAYDVHFSHAYFLRQLGHLAPKFALDTMRRAHLVGATPYLAITTALGLAAVLGLSTAVTRFVRPYTSTRPLTFWRWTYVAVIALSVATLALLHRAGLEDALGRWGPVLLALMLIGVVAIVLRPARYVDGTNGLMLLLVTCAYVLLFARRVKIPKPQVYNLYYDRYLYSEVLPAALLFAALGLHLVVRAWLRASKSRRGYHAGLAALLAIGLISLVPQVRETRRETKYRLFGDPYAALNGLNTLTRRDGTGAIVYSARPVVPVGWFFPNTYRAFALPLQETFGRDVVGMPTKALARDVPFTPEQASAALKAKGFTTGYLIRLRGPGGAPIADNAHVRYLGAVRYLCPTLGQSIHGPPAPWRVVTFNFDVYALS